MASPPYSFWFNRPTDIGCLGQITGPLLMNSYKFHFHFIAHKFVTMFIMFKEFCALNFLSVQTVWPSTDITFHRKQTPCGMKQKYNTTINKLELCPTSALFSASRFLRSVCGFAWRRRVGVASNKGPPTLGIWLQTATHFLFVKLSLSIPPTDPWRS
jgi:hypothetical protein